MARSTKGAREKQLKKQAHAESGGKRALEEGWRRLRGKFVGKHLWQRRPKIAAAGMRARSGRTRAREEKRRSLVGELEEMAHGKKRRQKQVGHVTTMPLEKSVYDTRESAKIVVREPVEKELLQMACCRCQLG
ncbi:hypothetical protein BWQ96_05414 [Gracilariopsis chorda]|uniref:Uncharacterized protein n=1 Tax=Gracilariopsis chorda TaxID=448386 RepID=A0A2V3IRS6_9FLOR|nr:hypothetical protein BWQ96_05414 [Gracilariopsis chorda]|eukprot:PXF44831.1 hypothetical protein BWQ96_05414 [Gracilariopsis chorda]